MLNKLGLDDTRRLIVIQKADNLSQNPEFVRNGMLALIESEKIIDKIIEEGQVFSLAQLAISGKDLIDMGLKPGPEVGLILQTLLEDVSDGNLENSKDVLCGEVLKYLKKQV